MRNKRTTTPKAIPTPDIGISVLDDARDIGIPPEQSCAAARDERAALDEVLELNRGALVGRVKKVCPVTKKLCTSLHTSNKDSMVITWLQPSIVPLYRFHLRHGSSSGCGAHLYA